MNVQTALKACFISLAFAPLGFLTSRGMAQVAPPSLEEVLKRLEANLDRYDSKLPSLFCDETVASKVEPSFPKQDDAVSSVFRLKRIANGDGTSSLVESRDVISVNGKKPEDRGADLPIQLDGAFEGAFAAVSLNQANCFAYSMKRVDKRHPTEPYVIRFNSRLTSHDSPNCLLSEKSSGFVRIDPTTFEITHLEINTPHHLIESGSGYISPYPSKRDIMIDYSPVSINRESFWLPSVIHLKVVRGAGTFHQISWSFHGEYRNCHQLQVTSRIVP